MPDVRLPLSGAVIQSINPWTAWFSPMGNQFGTVTINMGRSSDPKVEQEVLTDVASYGKQLGRIEDLLALLLDRLPPEPPLSARDTQVVSDFRSLRSAIMAVKHKHARADREA